ncbi:hypothetical protein HGP16_23570 [Rhizobium sp. P40RR-XXII]|uniref:hypothetical protein n=1 Tax=unclassified Rhizobium TaxID=2613769 RepID=UPI001457263F|nr:MULTISPECIES: hypothetical protein [unclassified Rhizobium]NLR87975.1 hypothetical protein [Rhizobium sp. P28RR-XV]NLS19520.1 hypothetical protein [Rhizobium sp. P40RR-XXII]
MGIPAARHEYLQLNYFLFSVLKAVVAGKLGFDDRPLDGENFRSDMSFIFMAAGQADMRELPVSVASDERKTTVSVRHTGTGLRAASGRTRLPISFGWLTGLRSTKPQTMARRIAPRHGYVSAGFSQLLSGAPKRGL